uniref:Uncharacterized protein n=1 Tax=Candidatus Kentrum sp. FM TaxID=2126340 RepID=A0A450STR1_9GAMM|nr:MAG: hypothetical protein BECKFM1743A_GA0114220_101887 [Candidatus Kentron sp. FM]VFJ58019.1 MAG: hypothetical protein BECKFM1743C_GA0114222_102142 [Candidatus Kentron sp. FM]VFK11826.1 MAG: hypothetical protein BECKFM1743B_GA0114221_102092 [Candidatus Kentron sp. FM]
MKLKRLCVLAISMCIFISPFAEEKDLTIMQYGAWGLRLHKDPFKNRHPAVSYLPPGTILFDSSSSPSYLDGYIEVLPQYGHKLHIKEKMSIPDATKETGAIKEISIHSPIKGLVEEPPTDSLIFHKSVLCLGQSNRISVPPHKCKKIRDDINSTLPVGWSLDKRPARSYLRDT